MEVGLCKNCKYFKVNSFGDNPENQPGFGSCLNSNIFSDYVNGWTINSNDRPNLNGIYSTCDENRGELIIGENFGCIHFENIS